MLQVSSAILTTMAKSKSFQCESKLRFHQADPSGWMFFGAAFELMHDCYEDFVVSMGFEWPKWFNNSEWAVPIRATEAEYNNVIRPGEVLQIDVSVLKVGETSFTLAFDFRQKEKSACVVKSTHTFLDKKNGQKRPIPDEIRQKLEAQL